MSARTWPSASAPIAIAAGGTGGHFFPAEALAATLIARGRRVVLLTDARSGGLKSAVFAGGETHVLPGAGIAGRSLVQAFKAVMALAAGVFRARSVLSSLGAGALVGFGGYPCVPPLMAIRLLRRRPAVILHEQNAVLGRANRSQAGAANCLALSFAGTTRVPRGTRTEVTGNPVRPAIAALAGAAYPAMGERLSLLILGGSLGARVFSDVVPEAVFALPAALRARLRVTQQCRPEDLERVRAAYVSAGIEADLAAFFGDVADRLRDAHLVIARAGASTVSELAVVGRPSILVPLPSAIDDHQTGNARALADAGGAWLMPQTAFTAAALTAKLTELLSDPAALTIAAAAARTQARPNAAAALADLVESLMNREALA
jgi:UDP-N-acetylglucosamine--N-acetylmuramyl-(pentapeptide) pyrophosphoryl-undecaprenol N-acetylglucosamine transferase